jgi:hypothetical protein
MWQQDVLRGAQHMAGTNNLYNECGIVLDLDELDKLEERGIRYDPYVIHSLKSVQDETELIEVIHHGQANALVGLVFDSTTELTCLSDQRS